MAARQAAYYQLVPKSRGSGRRFPYLGSAIVRVSGERSTIIHGDTPDSVDVGNIVVVVADFQFRSIDDRAILDDVASNGGEAS